MSIVVPVSMSAQMHAHVAANAPKALKDLATSAEAQNRGRGQSMVFEATPAKARELKTWLEKAAEKLAKSEQASDKDLARRARIVAKRIPESIKAAEKQAKADAKQQEQEPAADTPQPVAA